MARPSLVLHDKWGYGKQRIERFVWQCIDMLNAFNDGYLTVEDIHQTLKEECGVVIGKGAGKARMEWSKLNCQA